LLYVPVICKYKSTFREYFILYLFQHCYTFSALLYCFSIAIVFQHCYTVSAFYTLSALLYCFRIVVLFQHCYDVSALLYCFSIVVLFQHCYTVSALLCSFSILYSFSIVILFQNCCTVSALLYCFGIVILFRHCYTVSTLLYCFQANVLHRFCFFPKRPCRIRDPFRHLSKRYRKPGCEANYLSPFIVNIEEAWSYNSTFSCGFTTQFLKKHRLTVPFTTSKLRNIGIFVKVKGKIFSLHDIKLYGLVDT
jgi:hypothetical protein